MSDWSVLPNAAHIDAVIASVRQHYNVWVAMYGVNRSASWKALYDAAYGAAYSAAYRASWLASRRALYAARNAVGGAVMTYNGAWNPIQGSILALIAYDDCTKYLDMTAEQLEIWARLSDESAAVLLLPYVRVLERILNQSHV